MPTEKITPVMLLVYAAWAAALFTGLELGLRLASEVAGAWGVVLASIAFPATIAAAPLLALTWGQWVPAVVVYGGGLAATCLVARKNRAGRSFGPSATF